MYQPRANHSCILVKRPFPSRTTFECASEEYGTVARGIEWEHSTPSNRFPMADTLMSQLIVPAARMLENLAHRVELAPESLQWSHFGHSIEDVRVAMVLWRPGRV